MATITLVSGLLEAKSRVSKLTSTIGRAALNSQFPNDFEYYLCALELVDATNQNEVLDYLVFPIQPSSIQISNSKIQSTQKTAAGVVVMENNTFNPRDISISGNFGRKLKVLSASITSGSNINSKEKNTSKRLNDIGNSNVNTPQFSQYIKTGYGTSKVLERIFDSSSLSNAGKPTMLFFYCFAFNAHYLVQPMNLIMSQSEQGSNMIWNYSLQLKAIAPANEIKSSDAYKSTLSKYVSQDLINKGIQSSLDFVKGQSKILSNQISQKVGDFINLDDNLNKTPQITKALFLP